MVDDNEEIEGFTDAEIEASLADFKAAVDADYKKQFEPLLEVFLEKGPPEDDPTPLTDSPGS